jgi:hypothetical protein
LNSRFNYIYSSFNIMLINLTRYYQSRRAYLLHSSIIFFAVSYPCFIYESIKYFLSFLYIPANGSPSKAVSGSINIISTHLLESKSSTPLKPASLHKSSFFSLCKTIPFLFLSKILCNSLILSFI